MKSMLRAQPFDCSLIFDTVRQGKIFKLYLEQQPTLRTIQTNGIVHILSEQVNQKTGYHLAVHFWLFKSWVSIFRSYDLDQVEDAFAYSVIPINVYLTMCRPNHFASALNSLTEYLQMFPRWREHNWNAAHSAAALNCSEFFNNVPIASDSNKESKPDKQDKKKSKGLYQKLMGPKIEAQCKGELDGINPVWVSRPARVSTLTNFGLMESRNKNVPELTVPSGPNDLDSLKVYHDLIKQEIRAQTFSSRLNALMIAAISNSTESFKRIYRLLNEDSTGKWMFVRDSNGNNILHMIAWRIKASDMFDYLLKNEKPDTILKLLSQKNRFGCWPIHVACFRQNISFINLFLRLRLPIRLLVISRPSVTAEGINLKSSSDCDSDSEVQDGAKNSDNKKSADLYITLNDKTIKTFSMNEVTRGGCPLHWTVSYKVLAYLMMHGFKSQVCENVNGEYAMHVAVRTRNWNNLRTLFYSSHTHWVRQKDGLGETPLHLAVRQRLLTYTKLLLLFDHEGRAVNIKNHNGHTCRHIIARNLSRKDELILNSLHVCGAVRCAFSSTQTKDSSSDHSVDSIFEAHGSIGTACHAGCKSGDNFNGRTQITAHSVNIHEWITNMLSDQALDKLYNDLKTKADKLPKDPDANLHKTNCNASLNKKLFVDTFEDISLANQDEHEWLARNQSETVGAFSPTILRMLTVDGGGIRGLISVQILLQLQKYLKNPFVEYFNWYGGTSTGALVCALLTLGYSLIDVRLSYLSLKNRIFRNNPVADSKKFQSYVKRLSGERTMGRLNKVKLTMTTVMFDRKPLRLHLFRNYPSPESLIGLDPVRGTLGPLDENQPKTDAKPVADLNQLPLCPTQDQVQVWQACRASSAAPLLFTPCGSFIDGGLVSNNPTMDLLAEHTTYNHIARHCKGVHAQQTKLQLVVSIGNGVTGSESTKRFDYHSPALTPSALKNPLNWLSASRAMIRLVNMLSAACTANNDYVVSRLASHCHGSGIPFVRLNSLLSEHIKSSERDDLLLVEAMFDVNIYLHEKRHMLLKLCKILEFAHALSRPAFASSRKKLRLRSEDLIFDQSCDTFDPSLSDTMTPENLLELLLSELD